MHVRSFAGGSMWLRGVALVLTGSLPLCAQMHKVEAPEQVTRAVGVYEFIGDPAKPKAARLIPVSLFIHGEFEDAGVYLARPVPFALGTGFRYELQRSGVLQDNLDLMVSRNFAGSSAAVSQTFDNGWFGYGRVSGPEVEKAAKVRPNCGNAHVVEEAPKDDGKPHFKSKPAVDPKAAAAAIPQDCRDEEVVPKVTLDDSGKKDKDAADPERPTLHRSPTSTAGSKEKQKKGDKKPPEATVTQNGGPGDDPDRPMIRRRTVDEDDPNALPPDPLEYASTQKSKSTAVDSVAAGAKNARSAANTTVAEGGTIVGGDTMSGGPVLRRGKLTAAMDDTQPVVKSQAGVAGSSPARSAGVALPEPLESLVAVSDAKDRPRHDYQYKFQSTTDRATALSALEDMAREVVLKPALATDAPQEVVNAAGAGRSASSAGGGAGASKSAVKSSSVRKRATAAKAKNAAPVASQVALTNEQMQAYQLYFSAPVTYTYYATVPATADAPERFVTIVANTGFDGKLHAAMRTVTDAAHLARVPRYRPVDVVDADGSNRASILMEVRGQSSRQFALYRLLGNKTEQVYVSGATLL